MDDRSHQPTAQSDSSCRDAATEQARTEPCGSTWLSQADAAARTGFSVSALRKWRRMGVVADRKVSSPGGIERVEVRLEDVLARAALHPERQAADDATVPAETAAGGNSALPVGQVVVTIPDLEWLFERMVDAEQRARQAEAKVESLQRQARFMHGQLSELRRQLERGAGPAANGTTARRPTTEGPAGGEPTEVAPTAGGTEHVPDSTTHGRSVLRAHEAVPTNGGPRPLALDGNGLNGTRHHGVEAPMHQPSPGPEAERRSEELVGRLRTIYSRLDEFRRVEIATPEAEEQRQRLLAAYDRELVAVCAALQIPSGLPDGEPLTVEVRAALTRALANAGFDVRDGVRQPQTQKVRRIRSGLRF